MTIKVEIKTNYGKESIYPRCEKSEIFAKMLNQTTLTRKDIMSIKALGFEIEVIQPITKL